MTDPSSFVSKPHSSGGGEGGPQPSLGPERLFGSMCGKDGGVRWEAALSRRGGSLGPSGGKGTEWRLGRGGRAGSRMNREQMKHYFEGRRSYKNKPLTLLKDKLKTFVYKNADS